MKKILLGCMLLLAGAGCSDLFGGEGKDRREPVTDPSLPIGDPACRLCGAKGFACCPSTCREASGLPLNSDSCLYTLRCLPVTDAGGKACVD
jgi:hypothetical protein